jgi:sarcosine oxidase subunit gamma
VPATSAAGVDLPLLPNTTAGAANGDGDDGVSVLWLGPDEWLVVSGPDTTEEILGRLGGVPASTVDVSAQRTAIAVGGIVARDVLAHGCALDLERQLGVGRCAQTVLARAQVVLWRRDPDEYRVFVRSSFAGYLATWLLDAAMEHLCPDPPGGDVTTGCAAMDRTPAIRA